jgi:1,4-dihydroxy-2-naphthoate octaprenyltransferase
LKAWIEALRLRTLPLSTAGCLVAAGLAAWFGAFRWPLFLLMLLTVIALQIVANFADEYGDLQKGVDNDERIGPRRGMQRGEISFAQMRGALIAGALTALTLGIALIIVAWDDDPLFLAVFLAMGLVAIAGAISYTVGRYAYGYHALGDAACMLFFGIFAVSGGFILYAHSYHWVVALPTVAVGSLVTAFLNLNNLRDQANDAACGKTTLVVVLGDKRARGYYLALIAIGLLGFLLFNILSGITHPLRYLFLLLYPLLIWHTKRVSEVIDPAHYDPLMKPMGLITVALSASFALCVGL